MTCKFSLQANDQPRVLSRVLQVLDTQGVQISSFTAEQKTHGIWIELVIFAEDEKAYRIEALLHRLHDIHEIIRH